MALMGSCYGKPLWLLNLIGQNVEWVEPKVKRGTCVWWLTLVISPPLTYTQVCLCLSHIHTCPHTDVHMLAHTDSHPHSKEVCLGAGKILSSSLVSNSNPPVISLPDLNNDKTSDFAVLNYSTTGVASAVCIHTHTHTCTGTLKCVSNVPEKVPVVDLWSSV